MKILFTGASSFTGMWFVKALADAGHTVTAIFRKPLNQYSGTRHARIEKLLSQCNPVFGVEYGGQSFIDLIKNESHWDLFCHHASDVTDYKSPSFNAVQALVNNTGQIQNVLEALKDKSCQKIVLTGSVFEQNEGAGSFPLRAFSPYGLSKGLTSDVFRYYTDALGMSLGKFVIPNPFGPYEEVRFTTFLMQNWFAGKPVVVTLPAYVRDNIHVSLLAKAYVKFAQTLPSSPGFQKLNPSGYPESQGAFTTRFSKEISIRLPLKCEFELALQKEFPEPKVRINTDVLNPQELGWTESQAWDQLAEYYQQNLASTVTQ